MKALLDKILVKMESLISDLKKLLKPQSVRSQQLNVARYKVIKQAYEGLQFQIEKISTTTPILAEFKRKWLKQLESHSNANQNDNTSEKASPIEDRCINADDDFMRQSNHNQSDAIIKENQSTILKNSIGKQTSNIRSKSTLVAPQIQKQEKSSTKQPLYNKPETNTPLETTMAEFSELKSIVNKLKISFNEHKHVQYETNLEKLGNVVLKLESEYGVIQNEMTELLHSVHKLNQRMELLEADSIKQRVDIGHDQYLTARNEPKETQYLTDVKMIGNSKAEYPRVEAKSFLISQRKKSTDNANLSAWAKERIQDDS